MTKEVVRKGPDNRGVRSTGDVKPEEEEKQALQLLFAGHDLDEVAKRLKLSSYSIAFNRAGRHALRILCREANLPDGPGIKIDARGNFPRRPGSVTKSPTVTVKDDHDALVMFLREGKKTTEIASNFNFQSDEAGRQMVLRGALREVEALRQVREGIKSGTFKADDDGEVTAVPAPMASTPSTDESTSFDGLVAAVADAARQGVTVDRNGLVPLGDVVAKLQEIERSFADAADALAKVDAGSKTVSDLRANAAGVRSAIAPISGLVPVREAAIG